MTAGKENHRGYGRCAGTLGFRRHGSTREALLRKAPPRTARPHAKTSTGRGRAATLPPPGGVATRLGSGRNSQTGQRLRPKSPSTPSGPILGVPCRTSNYVAEHDISEEEWPEAFARWIAERTGGPVPRFEQVEPGDEQIQRDLDAVPSALDPGAWTGASKR